MLNEASRIALCAVTIGVMVLPAVAARPAGASGHLLKNGYYSCNGSYPCHANTVVGEGDHDHTISWMHEHDVEGRFLNKKTVRPTDANHHMAGTGSLLHTLINTRDPAGTGSVYCRS